MITTKIYNQFLKLESKHKDAFLQVKLQKVIVDGMGYSDAGYREAEHELRKLKKRYDTAQWKAVCYVMEHNIT